MRKLFKLMIALELIVAFGSFVIWLMTKDESDWSGLVFFYPLIGLQILIIAGLLLEYISALGTIGRNNLSPFKLLLNLIILFGVPGLALLYSINGEDRLKLKVISFILLGISVIVAARKISNNIKSN